MLIEENAKEIISLDSLVCEIFLLVAFFPFLASLFHLNLRISIIVDGLVIVREHVVLLIFHLVLLLLNVLARFYFY